MKLYGLKTCDTCRKALKMLASADFIDVRADGVPAEILERAYGEFGDALVNKKSATWRNLPKDDQLQPPLDLLMLHPTLMKRPLIETDEGFFLGWSVQTQHALGAG